MSKRILFCALLVACSASRPIMRQHRVTYHDEVGAAHVAVLTIKPFHEYKDTLQPRFELTEAQALQAAIATTAAIQEAIVDAFSLAVKLAPGKTTDEKTTETTTEPGKEPQTSVQQTETRAPGDLSSVTEAPLRTEKASALPQRKDVLETKLGRNPMLTYLAATALLQEVEMLNTYVRDAAIYDGFRPYILRLQVSLQPLARNVPYDAFTTVSFFYGAKESGSPRTLVRLARVDPAAAASRLRPLIESAGTGPTARALSRVWKADPEALNSLLPSDASARATAIGHAEGVLQTSDREAARTLYRRIVAARERENGAGPLAQALAESDVSEEERATFLGALIGSGKPQSPELALAALLRPAREETAIASVEFLLDAKTGEVRILPLLVTDNLEAALHSSSREEIRDMSFALAVMLQNFAGNFNTRRFVDDLQSVVTEDINGILTVARASDNSVRVRFGASQIGPDHYSMVARTQNVTVVVLVPDGAVKDPEFAVDLVARTEFVDARDGNRLPDRGAILLGEARRRVNLYAPTPLDEKQVTRLMHETQSNDQEEFGNLLKEARIEKAYLQAVWTELVDLRSRSRYTSARVTLPATGDPTVPDQRPLLLDDGTTMQTTLYGAAHIVASELAAALVVTPTAGTDYTFAATSFRVDGRRVTITFPSLAKWKLQGIDVASIYLQLLRVDDAGATHKIGTGMPCDHRVVAAPQPPAAPVILYVTQSGVRVKEGLLVITLDRDENVADELLLTVVTGGASIDVGASVLDGVLSPKVSTPEFVIVKDGTVKLKLIGLATKTDMRLQVKRTGKDVGPPLVVPVID